MNKIMINLVDQADRGTLNYQGVDNKIQNLKPKDLLDSHDEDEILNFIQNLNSNDEPLIFTFLGHAATNGLSVDKKIIHYESLLAIINSTATVHPVYVNLLANCNSFNAVDYLPENNKIAEIWFTNTTTESIHMSLNALQVGSFSKFLNQLTPGQTTYGQYINEI